MPAQIELDCAGRELICNPGNNLNTQGRLIAQHTGDSQFTAISQRRYSYTQQGTWRK